MKLKKSTSFCAEDKFGNKWWYDKYKHYHREGGPAVEYYNYKAWYKHGVLHRTDGPAVEYADGHKEWHLHGIHYISEKYWKEALNANN